MFTLPKVKYRVNTFSVIIPLTSFPQQNISNIPRETLKTSNRTILTKRNKAEALQSDFKTCILRCSCNQLSMVLTYTYTLTTATEFILQKHVYTSPTLDCPQRATNTDWVKNSLFKWGYWEFWASICSHLKRIPTYYSLQWSAQNQSKTGM